MPTTAKSETKSSSTVTHHLVPIEKVIAALRLALKDGKTHVDLIDKGIVIGPEGVAGSELLVDYVEY